MEDKQPKENKKNKLRIAIIVLMSIALIGVGTYAIGSGFGITNSDYSYHTACFDVSYDITNDDGTRDISGNLIPGENYMDGLNGQVSIRLDPSCGLTGLGNLYLKIDDNGGGSTAVQTVRPHCENPETLETLTEYTDEESCSASANGKWVTTGSALKYAVYEYNSDRIVSVGYVNKVNEKINIHNDFDVMELVKFDIYVWLDGNLVDNSYINLSLRGAISADVVQISGNMVSSPSAPVLDDGMIPVTIANDGVVTTISKTDSAWYNYNNKEWANVVLVDSDSRSTYKDSTGVVVNQDDILAYYVWIPRYKYKIWDVTGTSSPLTISVMFESKLEEPTYGTTLGSWRTHPAFIWNGNPVAGIWVGKFEATGSADVPTILPNNIALANQSVGDQFTTALKFAGGTFSDGNVRFAGSDTYGLSKNTDSHMMKNSEWGAIAYLSHSKYGIDKEIMINNYPYTGCRATEENAERSEVCQIFYGETNHYSQTTTGNITGLFDVSGGIWEYTMANYNGLFTETNGFTVLPPTKYYDKYTSMDPLTACNGGICFGHAISETKDWYNDYFYMTDEQYLWSARGGANYGGINSGVFALSRDDGNPHSFLSWRSVLVNVEKRAIKYNPNGGIGTMSDMTCVYGQSCTLSTNTFTRTGYTFAGWNTSADGTGTDYSDGYTFSEFNYDSDITLYAQWSVHNVWIQFDTEGGTIASPTTLEGINYTWTADSNGIISRSADGGDYNNKWFNISYGTERNLPNYDYAYYINISKTGYSAVSEAEWICLSGCSTSGATFNDLLDYSSDAFCDASNGDCTVVLGVNWNANTYTIKYYLGNGTSTAGSTMLGTSECTYGSTSCKLSKFSATFPNSTNGWSFAGWGTSNSDTSVDYNDEKTFDNSITEDMSLYAIGSRTLNFYSGTAGESIGSKTQYWNPYSIDTSYYTSITPPAATSLSAYGWSCRGFRGNNIASSTYAAPCTGSYTPPPNELTSFDFRTIYKRTLTLKFDGNGSTSGSTSDISETQYFNSGMNNSGQNVSAVSFTLPSNGFTKTNYAFSNWCETTAGGGTCTAAGGTYSAWTPAVNTTTVTKTLYASWNRVYSNTWVDGKSSSFEVTPNSVGGSANVTLKIFWKESYNEYLNQSKVSITNVQAKISARTGYVYYLGGSDAESSTSSGIYINGTRNYAMSTYTGGYNVYLGSANTYVSITSKNAFPWTSAAITHSSDGTKTIPIRVYLNVVRQTSPGSYYSKFDKTTNITLTDLRE